MRERVELLVGRATRAMWVMTFHSACARMLRADAHRLGYTRQFTIYDSADSRRLIKKCLDDLDIDPKRFTPRAMQVQISDAKNKLRSADDYRDLVGSFFEQTVADVYESYERELHRANAMDFDDLLFRAVNLLELFQEVRDRYANAFRWILVDEYQDTNRAQYRWLQLLSSASTATWPWSATTTSAWSTGTLDHDGRRVEAADRARAGGRSRSSRATAAAISAARWYGRRPRSHEGIAITLRPTPIVYGRARPLRRLPRARPHMTYLRGAAGPLSTTRTYRRRAAGQRRGTARAGARDALIVSTRDSEAEAQAEETSFAPVSAADDSVHSACGERTSCATSA